MKRSVSVIVCILLAAALSSPAWAGNGNGKGKGNGKGNGVGAGNGGESQAGGLPALEDRVEADEAMITTLQGQVAVLMGDIATLNSEIADLQGQNNWAVVDSAGTIARASSVAVVEGDTHVAASGVYEVDFGKDVSKCAYQATIGGTGTVAVPPGEIEVTGDTDGDSPNDVTVSTFNSAGTATDSSFHLTVTCP